MERHDVPGSVFAPMRIMSSSEYVELEIKGGDFELSSPSGIGRNSVRRIGPSSLGLLVNRKNKWRAATLGRALTVLHRDAVVNEDISISDGRSESDSL